jgi:hypothetical protein
LVLSAAVVLIMNAPKVRYSVNEKRRLWDDRRRYRETAAETRPADHVVFDGPMDRPLSQATQDPPGRWQLLWAKQQYSPVRGREPVLFQHEMTTASGMRVLVAVQMDLAARPERQLIVSMLKPGTLSQHPWRYGPFVALTDDRLFEKPLRFFAGQVDPNDDRHFTIRYMNGRETGVLDGQMVDDPGATTYREFGTIRIATIPDRRP